MRPCLKRTNTTVDIPINDSLFFLCAEKSPEGKKFLIEVFNRSAMIVINVILMHVRHGSTIITDCFKNYHHIEDPSQHLKMKQSVTFVDSISDARTNIIEAM
ncbi:hypothetical protein HZS_6171 [Henneguya salminicola]|nr:hypothetical protein HZS_6171 [Henneguya salminicola]